MRTKDLYEVRLTNGKLIGLYRGQKTISRTFQINETLVSRLVNGHLKSLRGYTIRRVKE